MSAPTITFRQAAEAGACRESVRRMAEHLGGIEAWGRDTPIPITTVLDVLGLEDTIWALEAIGAERTLRLFAADCAEHVLPLFEAERPGDRHPHEAVRQARLYAHGLTTPDALAAARAAAGAAARAAAWAAAWAAERAWQITRLREAVTP